MNNIKLENLEINGYHLYQDKTSFNFGIDAVLLANFALRESTLVGASTAGPAPAQPVRASYASPLKLCDLCTGTLPIPLIIYAKSNLVGTISHTNSQSSPTRRGERIRRGCKPCEPALIIDAFEIDPDQVSLCNKSILWNKKNVPAANHIDSDIKVYNDDIKNIFIERDKYKKLYESYDLVTVNPPYNKKGSGLTNLNDKKIAARHEISITFDDICHAANLLLKSNKKFYFINQTSRFTEIVTTLKKYSFEIKKLVFIHPYVNKASNLFMVEAVKGGRQGVKVLPPIIIYQKPNIYTDEILKIYGK